MSRNRVAVLTAVVGFFACLAFVSAQRMDADIPFPVGFRDWFVVNSMIVTKDSKPFSPIAGMHIIYVNAKGRATLEKGGPFPYPDGTMFADDVHEFSEVNGSYVEGKKKAVTVMVKDARKYAAAGGWGFQAWANGDSSKPLIHDTAQSVSACLSCHTPRKEQDYTFSTFIP